MEVELRFGMHRDIQLIHHAVDCIDGLVVPAHILAHQKPSTASFVASLVEKHYVIDPMTFVFQNPCRHHLSETKDGELRPSIASLSSTYHDDLEAAIRSQPELGPADFQEIDLICANSAQFQLTAVADGVGLSAARKYLARYPSASRATAPRFLIPPYFYFNSVDDDWYHLTLAAANATAELGHSPPVAPIICCSSTTLRASVARIVEDFAAFSHVYLWVAGYDERGVRRDEVQGVRDAITQIVGEKDRVATLYGGFLFVLSAHDGLAGLSHGVLYTQHKSHTLSPGSGGPPERFYIPRFHQFRSLSQTDLIIREHPELICDCEVCDEVLAGNPDNIIRYFDQPDLLRQHFLTVRRAECDQVLGTSLPAWRAQLLETFAEYHASVSALPNPDAFVSRTPMVGLTYLREWAEALPAS